MSLDILAVGGQGETDNTEVRSQKSKSQNCGIADASEPAACRGLKDTAARRLGTSRMAYVSAYGPLAYVALSSAQSRNESRNVSENTNVTNM